MNSVSYEMNLYFQPLQDTDMTM